MKTLSAAFEIETKAGVFKVKYFAHDRTWKIYTGGKWFATVEEFRTHQFKNETRAKEILKAALSQDGQGG